MEPSSQRFNREQLQTDMSALASKSVYVGTSSWKYAGWRGMLYDESRYITRGKVAESRFERDCLTEYAEVFKTVCVDAGYYRFPEERYLKGLVSQVPEDFQFTFKVTDEITIKKFPNQPRHGQRAGKPNENFLNADLFARAFVKQFEPFKNNVGLFMFEFSKFYPTDYAHGRDFVADLDRFLGSLPKDWRYGVEIRNKYFLKPEYFQMLASHGVTHVYNSWADMPPVSEQLDLPGASPIPDFTGARFLLKPGRNYEAAVKEFSPYKEIKEVYEDARIAAAKLIKKSLSGEGAKRLYLYVNNRLEGNALQSILGILEKVNAR